MNPRILLSVITLSVLALAGGLAATFYGDPILGTWRVKDRHCGVMLAGDPLREIRLRFLPDGSYHMIRPDGITKVLRWKRLDEPVFEMKIAPWAQLLPASDLPSDVGDLPGVILTRYESGVMYRMEDLGHSVVLEDGVLKDSGTPYALHAERTGFNVRRVWKWIQDRF